jgi:hypothetical protein
MDLHVARHSFFPLAIRPHVVPAAVPEQPPAEVSQALLQDATLHDFVHLWVCNSNGLPGACRWRAFPFAWMGEVGSRSSCGDMVASMKA